MSDTNSYKRAIANKKILKDSFSNVKNEIAKLWGKDGRVFKSNLRFFMGFVLGMLIVLISIASVNFYINPWGNYGDKGVFPLYNVRKTKSEYLALQPISNLPEIVVVGSSNTMRFRPEIIESLFGKTAFNFGVFWGRADDVFTISQFCLSLPQKPEAFIVGIDPWTMTSDDDVHLVFDTVRRRMINAPLMWHFHPKYNYILSHWSNFLDLLSFEQFKIARHALKSGRKPSLMDPLGVGSFTTDGNRTHYGHPFGKPINVFPEVEAGIFDYGTELLQDHAKKGDRSAISRWSKHRFEGLNPFMMDCLKSMVEICGEKDIKVVFVELPIHPIIRKGKLETEAYQRNLNEVSDFLNTVLERFPDTATHVDCSELKTFGGVSGDFYDHQHFGTRNSDLILQYVRSQIGEL